MKKKLLLLLSSTLTLSAGIAAVAITNKNEAKFSVVGQNEPTTFMLDYSSVQLVEDNKYQAVMTSEKGHSVRVMIEGVTLKNERLYVAGPNYDCILYNLDPIRGINAYMVDLDNQYGSNRLVSQSMFSYNQIDFDEVLSGKYQDLIYSFKETYISSGNYECSDDISSTPKLGQARYFLSHLIANSTEAKLSMIGVQSVCAAEPSGVPIGTNVGSFCEDDETAFENIFGDSIEFDEAGNGAYYISYSYFYQSCKSGETASFVAAALDQGYALTASVEGQDVYQKRVAGGVYTFLVEVRECEFCDILRISFDDSYDYLEKYYTWPSAYLNEKLSERHENIIPGISNTITNQYIEYYQTTSFDEGSFVMVGVIAILKDGVTESDVTTIFDSFRAGFNQTLWDVDNRSAYYNDGLLEIYFGFYNGIIEIEIEETKVSTTPPSASDINSNYSEDIYIVNGGEGALYNYNGYGSSYRIYNCQNNAFNNTITGFENAGYTTSSLTSGSATFTKYVNEYGDYISAEIYYYSGSAYMSVSYYLVGYQRNQYYSFYDLLMNIYHGSDSDCSVIASGLTLPETYEYYAVLSGNTYGIIKNAGSEFLTQFSTVFASNYVDALDGYKFSDNYILKFEQLNGSIKVYFKYYSVVTFHNYSNFNQSIDSILSSYSLDSSLAIHIEDSDNVGNRFAYYTNESYFGSKSDVESFKQLLIQKINANGNYRYSLYLDKYINVASGFAIELCISSPDDIYYLYISYSRNVEFIDYQSYNELNIGDIALLSNFPSFISENEKDEKYFVNLNVSEGGDSVNCDVSKDAGFNEGYIQSLLNNGFSQIEGYTYGKLIGDYFYTFSFYSNGKTYLVYFSKVMGPFINHDDLFEIIGTENGEYLDSFGFSTIFNSSQTVYFPNDPSYQSLIVCDVTAINAYKTYLLNNGYEYMNNQYAGFTNSYVKSNADKNDFKIVQFVDYGPLSQITFRAQTIPFTTWESTKTSFGSTHDYDTLKDFIVYPDDGEGNLYHLDEDSVTESRIRLCLNANYDIDSYISRIIVHNNFIREYVTKYYTEYAFEEGRVTIYDLGLFYEVTILCNHYAGSSFSNAIAFIGDTLNIEVRSTMTYYRIVPEKGSTYKIYTTGSCDTYGVLYDINHNQLTSNDNGYSDSNFSFQYELEAGKTYYIGVLLRSSSSTIYPAVLNIDDLVYEGDNMTNCIHVSLGTTNIVVHRTSTWLVFYPEEAGTYRISSPDNKYSYASVRTYVNYVFNIIASSDGPDFSLECELDPSYSYLMCIKGTEKFETTLTIEKVG